MDDKKMNKKESSVKVAVRVRPLNEREMNSDVIISMTGNQTSIQTDQHKPLDNSHIPISNKPSQRKFVYDYSYWSVNETDPHFVSQEQVFNDLGTKVLDAAFEGYNACVFAYGQTGAGKTYTMMGTQSDPGLIPRICEGLYKHASANANNHESFRIEVSYLEIYNEQVLDLLRSETQSKRSTSAQKLRVREHPKEGPYVQGLMKQNAPDYATIESILKQGNQMRKTEATKMNEHSSRSHAIFTITYTQAKFITGLPSELTSKINLVDLAGSERASKSGATGERLREGGNINKSLATLGSVISALSETSSRDGEIVKKPHVPYRNSILTWLLKDSLGGNSKTIMIAAIAPTDLHYGETLSTLRFAVRAKKIVNAPTINEDPNVKLIRELKAEIERLKSIVNTDQSQFENSMKDETVNEAQKLLKGTESKMEQHLREWADKWRDTMLIMEENDLGLHKYRSALRINMDPPHLVVLDDDVLNTSITIFSLKEGENSIGSMEIEDELHLVFDEEEQEKRHCILTFDMKTVILIPMDGECQINSKTVTEDTKLSQGDIIMFDQTFRLKFNNPQEAFFLRKKRKTHRSMERSLHKSPSPDKLVEFFEQPLSPESGVEQSTDDGNDENDPEELKLRIEELLAKYKQSEIERMKVMEKSKRELEEKDKQIEDQTMKILQKKEQHEVVLQKHQEDLQELREQLSQEKKNSRNELIQQIENIFIRMKNGNSEQGKNSTEEDEQRKKLFRKKLKREWSRIDQCEMKLIEIEAEKRRIIQDADEKLKEERVKKKADRERRRHKLETKIQCLQETLDNLLKKSKTVKKDFENVKEQAAKLTEQIEENNDSYWKKCVTLEWLQYQLCTDQVDNDDDISEIMLIIKTFVRNMEMFENQITTRQQKISLCEKELEERQEVLKEIDAEMKENSAAMAAAKEALLASDECPDEENDDHNIIILERDTDLVKIEKEGELLVSAHLEHQRVVEAIVSDHFDSSDDEDAEIKNFKAQVFELVRCVSPGVEEGTLQSQIASKKLEIHYQQTEVRRREEERKTLNNHEEDYHQLNQAVNKQREDEQMHLKEKINHLRKLTESGETLKYYECESNSLVSAQQRLLEMDDKLALKTHEKKKMDARFENLRASMEQQDECNQAKFRDKMDELDKRGRQLDREIRGIRKMIETEAEEYLKRLKTEDFAILEPLGNSIYAKIASDAMLNVLEEIKLASHHPMFAINRLETAKLDCGGWRYETNERDVHVLRKEDVPCGVYSFLGRGIIRATPRIVLQTVATPPSRFVYDRMLKKIRIVDKISDNLAIIYMMHETQRCLLKTSRDFCFVAMDGEKDGKFVLASHSVEHPSCPEVKGVKRGQILSSGWVIEQITINGRSCSLVWYMTQVHLGGSLPSTVLNLISKRQPLSISYLREYLVAN